MLHFKPGERIGTNFLFLSLTKILLSYPGYNNYMILFLSTPAMFTKLIKFKVILALSVYKGQVNLVNTAGSGQKCY